MQTATQQQRRGATLIQEIIKYRTGIQKWCGEIFPDDPARARQTAKQALVQLLRRVEEREVANLGAWVYLTTWSVCLQSIEGVRNGPRPGAGRPARGLEPTGLPWLQGIKIINGLEEKQRIAIKLKDLSGFTYEEIAQVTGESPAQIQNYVIEGRRNFLVKWDKLRQLGKTGARHASYEQAAGAIERELRVIFPHMRAEIKECPDEMQRLHFFEGTLSSVESEVVNRHTRVCGICDLLLNRLAEYRREEEWKKISGEASAEAERVRRYTAATPPSPARSVASGTVALNIREARLIPMESKSARKSDAPAQAGAPKRSVAHATPPLSAVPPPVPSDPPARVLHLEPVKPEDTVDATPAGSGSALNRPLDSRPVNPAEESLPPRLSRTRQTLRWILAGALIVSIALIVLSYWLGKH